MATPAVEHQAENALNMLRQGVKPTVQGLVQTGCSASTATAALQYLYETRLREILRGDEVANPVTDTEFERAFRNAWSLAFDAAKKQVQEDYSGRVAALEVAKANLDHREQRLLEENELHQQAKAKALEELGAALTELEQVSARCRALTDQLSRANAATNDAITQRDTARNERDRLADDVASARASLEQAKRAAELAAQQHAGAIAALGAQHERAMAELKDHYVARDQKNMVAIDDLKGQLAKATKKIDDLLQAKAAEAAAHSRELGRITAERDAAAASAGQLKAKLQAAAEARDTVEAERDGLRDRIAALEEEIAGTKAELEIAGNDLQLRIKELAESTAEVSRLQGLLAQATSLATPTPPEGQQP